MTCAQAGMKASASGSAVVVMWNYLVAPISFSSVCTLIPCSSVRRLWMLFCGLEERACYWQKTWNLCVFLSWTNSEFAVSITLGNSSLSPPSSIVEFLFNLSCDGFCMLGLCVSPWGSRERTRWGKYKQTRAGKAVCGELCLWWHKRQCNFHVPVPLVFMQVPQASCLRTMEQTLINLLTRELNAPRVKRLVKSKHSQGSGTDPVRAVRRRVVSWRQFKRYRRRALQLQQVQPSVFRSPRVVTAIVYALQLMFDLTSNSLKSFLAQKFLRSNCVDADTVYHLYRVASHVGDPYYKTLCRSKLTDVLSFRQLPVPRPCIPLSILLLLPQRQFARWFEVPWISASVFLRIASFLITFLQRGSCLLAIRRSKMYCAATWMLYSHGRLMKPRNRGMDVSLREYPCWSLGGLVG